MKQGSRVVATDAVVALVMGVFIALSSLGPLATVEPKHRPLDVLGYLLIGLTAAPLAFRRSWPLPAFGCAVVAAGAYLLSGYAPDSVFLVVGVSAYSLAVRATWRTSALACALVLPVVMYAHLMNQQVSTAPQALQAGITVVSWLGLPWALGIALRIRDQRTLRRQREEHRRRSYEERLQVAREVHDVVGQSLAVINMQAGVALHVGDRRPERSQEALEAIEKTSKETLASLRATLAVFERYDGAPAAARPGLGQLSALAAAMSQSGLRVALAGNWDSRPLPTALELAVYRIVQESLTNVLRHAGSTEATVRVDFSDNTIDIEITDTGSGFASQDAPWTPGHGIAGMRERAEALGGTFVAGPRSHGGFRVAAHLPCEDM